MARTIPEEKLKLLDDKDQLYQLHVVEKFSIVELSQIIGVTPSVVTKKLRAHSIESPPQQQLREASNLRKFGKKNPGQVTEYRAKAMDTMVQRYGGHNWSNAGNREARDKTCLERYGNVNVGKTEHAKQKAKETNVERYGRNHANQKHISDTSFNNLEDIGWLYEQHFVNQRSLSNIADELRVDMTIVMNRLHQHHLETQRFKHSSGEKEILDFVTSLLPGNEIIPNTFSVIFPKELDIYIPSQNLAIEYCGLYWHSEQMGKDKWYHRSKWERCNEQGIQLITVFEDEWMSRQEQVKSKLKSLLNIDDRGNIFARKCDIVEVSTLTKQRFFDTNHIQGDGPGSINIGLEYRGELVACMSFIKQKDQHYLNRYATSKRVVGGFSKLLKHFKRVYEWRTLISFADLRWSAGRLYETNGWTLDKVIPPDYCYVVRNKRFHKFTYRRKYLPVKLTNFDPELSERENCDANGVFRLWDCGKMRYVIHNN